MEEQYGRNRYEIMSKDNKKLKEYNKAIPMQEKWIYKRFLSHIVQKMNIKVLKFGDTGIEKCKFFFPKHLLETKMWILIK